MRVHNSYTPNKQAVNTFSLAARKEIVKVPIPLDLREDAIDRGRRSRHMQFDAAANIEIKEFGWRFIYWFIRGYVQ